MMKIPRFATIAQVLRGTSTSTIVTPAGLAEALSQMPTALLHVQDQKPSGTDGGDFNSGAWRTRDLNTVLTNEIDGASLASNQITLPAGTYYIEASAPSFAVTHNMVRLQDMTGGSTLLWGINAWSGADGSDSDRGQPASRVSGRLTLSETSVLELQHRCGVSRSTIGFGVSVDDYLGGSGHETYTDARIWKIGL